MCFFFWSEKFGIERGKSSDRQKYLNDSKMKKGTNTPNKGTGDGRKRSTSSKGAVDQKEREEFEKFEKEMGLYISRLDKKDSIQVSFLFFKKD